MSPTAFLRKQRRSAERRADPNTPIREGYKRIIRAAGLRLADWPLEVRRSRKHPLQATGRCEYGGRVVVTVGVSAGPALWQALLLHEVAHAATVSGHCDHWRSVFIQLAADVYGVRVQRASGSSHDLHAAVASALSELE